MKELKELEEEYVSLVNKAEDILEEIHSKKEGFPPEAINKSRTLLNNRANRIKNKISNLSKETGEEDVRLDSLTKIKGIGEETVRDIKNIYSNYDDLVEDIKLGKTIPLRNDVAKKLKKHITKQEV